MLREFTIDLEEAAAGFDEDIAANKEAEHALLEKVAGFDDGFDDPECPEAYEQKFYELRAERVELEADKSRIQEFVEDTDWEHYAIRFKEPSTEDALYVQGRSAALAEEAAKRGKKIQDGVFGVAEMLERCVVEKPQGAPDDLGALPRRVGNWVLNRLNEETMAGSGGDLGNSSPREALEDFKRSRD